MLISWHASAERMLQSSWFNKSLEQLLTLCAEIPLFHIQLTSLLGLLLSLGDPVLVGIRCRRCFEVVKLSPLRPFRALLCRMNLQLMQVLFQTSVLLKDSSLIQVIL